MAMGTMAAQAERTGKGHAAVKASRVNVADVERWASLAGGGLLAYCGLKQGGLGGLTLAALGGGLVYRGLTGHCSMYQSLGLNTAGGVKVERSTTIAKPPAEVYEFWRKLSNLPRFMNHLEEVRELGGGRSHWVAKGPLGTRVQWDAELISERPGRLIAWRSLPGAQVDNAGSVHFLPAPDGRGTEVRVSIKYDPPAGKLGSAIAWLTGEEPGVQVADDLKRLKRVLETGEAAAARA